MFKIFSHSKNKRYEFYKLRNLMFLLNIDNKLINNFSAFEFLHVIYNLL